MIKAWMNAFFREGALMLRMPDRHLMSVNGATETNAPLIVYVRTYRALLRIVSDPNLHAGEAYMDGDLIMERGSIYDLAALATRNARLQKQRRRVIGRDRVSAARKIAKRNVAHHYDLSGELYRLFLDADRQYSCAYFSERQMTLEQAQIAKKRHLAAKLLLAPGQRVLDIGCGWGGLALSLAEEEGADVLGVTLSEEQWREAEASAQKRGLADCARFELKDYRDLNGRFDRIVSVGMFEHVGPTQYRTYFQTFARLLDDEGVGVMHTIGRFDGAGAVNAWIEKYIFPGGYIPCLSEIMAAVEQSGLIVTDVEVLRLHYAETLKAWRERFAAVRDDVRALYDERFCRMWEFYLAGSEAGFREGSLVVFQVQLAKNRNSVPLTRDYITEFHRARDLKRTLIAAE